MKILSLGHRSGHGKDTTADFMVEWVKRNRPDIRVRKWSWAWKLKLVCYDLYGHHAGMYSPEYYDTDEGYKLRNVKIPTLGLTIVELWIKVGEGLRNQVYQNTWAEWPKAHLPKDYDLIIAADTRKYTETAVSDYAIKVWNPRTPDRTGASIDGELQDFRWNCVIVNDQDREALRQQAEDWIFILVEKWFPNILTQIAVDDKIVNIGCRYVEPSTVNIQGSSTVILIGEAPYKSSDMSMSEAEAEDLIHRDNILKEKNDVFLKVYHEEHGGSYTHDDLAKPGI